MVTKKTFFRKLKSLQGQLSPDLLIQHSGSKGKRSTKKIVHVTSNEDYFKSLNFLGKIASCHRIAVIIVTLNAISPKDFRLLDSYSVVEKSCLFC